MNNSVAFNTFTCCAATNHLYLVPKHFHHTKIQPHTHWAAPGNHQPVSVDFPALDISRQWNHMIRDVSCLVFFQLALRFWGLSNIVACISTSLPFFKVPSSIYTLPSHLECTLPRASPLHQAGNTTATNALWLQKWLVKDALIFAVRFLLFPWKARKTFLVEGYFQNLVNLKMRDFNYLFTRRAPGDWRTRHKTDVSESFVSA